METVRADTDDRDCSIENDGARVIFGNAIGFIHPWEIIMRAVRFFTLTSLALLTVSTAYASERCLPGVPCVHGGGGVGSFGAPSHGSTFKPLQVQNTRYNGTFARRDTDARPVRAMGYGGTGSGGTTDPLCALCGNGGRAH